jgi:hypothetical protein
MQIFSTSIGHLSPLKIENNLRDLIKKRELIKLTCVY